MPVFWFIHLKMVWAAVIQGTAEVKRELECRTLIDSVHSDDCVCVVCCVTGHLRGVVQMASRQPGTVHEGDWSWRRSSACSTIIITSSTTTNISSSAVITHSCPGSSSTPVHHYSSFTTHNHSYSSFDRIITIIYSCNTTTTTTTTRTFSGKTGRSGDRWPRGTRDWCERKQSLSFQNRGQQWKRE